MWIPWRGPVYDDRRMLIVGESCYNWDGPHGIECPQMYHPVALVSEQLTEPASPNRFMVKLSRAVTGTEWPNLARRLTGWRSVAFTNFIPITVGYGPGAVKTAAMWRQARDG